MSETEERSPFRVIRRLARAPHYRRAERLLRRRSGIRADTVSDEQPHVDRRKLSETEERSPFRVIGKLCLHCASIARAPHYRRAERLLRRRSGSVAASGLTPFPMSSPKLIVADCPRQSEELPMLSDDYTFHRSGATLSSKGTFVA